MIHALAKESLFSGGLFSWVMAALGGVPVNRGAADRDALKAAQSLLEQGASSSYFLKVRDKQEILLGRLMMERHF